MGNEDKNRTIVYVDADDFDDIYKKLIKSHYFKGLKNIDLFLCATLVGMNVVGKPLPLDNSNKKDYFRVVDNKNKESMIILKSLAISKFNDVNVLSDEDKLFSFCEDYANAGIKQLGAWYNSNEESFENILTKELLKSWQTLDLDKIKDES